MNYRFRYHINEIRFSSYSEEPECIKGIPKDEIIDCSFGINPFGFSEKAKQKMYELSNPSSFERINNYGEPLAATLCENVEKRFGKICGFTKDNVRMSSGSINALDRVCRLFIDQGTKVLGVSPQFGDFVWNLYSYGGKHCPLPLKKENGYKFCVEEFLKAITPEYSLIYIDNPNNPTGQIIPLEEMREICRIARKHFVTVLVDEAYGDFMEDKESAMNLVQEYENVVVVRSFSKGLGLAGLRCGFVVADKNFIKSYDLIDIPFSVPKLHYDIITEALFDTTFLRESVQKIKQSKEIFINSLKNIDVWATSDTTPIMTLSSKDPKTNLFEEFAKRKVYVEPSFGFPGMPGNAVRLRIPVDVCRLIDAIGDLK